MTTYAHIRRSKDKQDEASQREKIRQWSAREQTKIDEWDSDAASGGVPWQDRGLGQLMARMQPGDMVVFSEISRIARSTVGVLSFLEEALKRDINIVAIDVGIRLDGSLAAQVVANAFAMAAQIERYLLRSRTKAALDARKLRGLPVGRQPGALGRKSKLDGKEQEIARLMQAKVPKAAIARTLSVARGTLDAFIERAEKEREEREKKTDEDAGRMGI